jgi:hypothetical protein
MSTNQILCDAGYKNRDYSNIYEGSCTPCTGQVQGTYWGPNKRMLQ